LGIYKAKFRVSEHQKILVYPLIRELAPIKFKRTIFEEAESILSIDKENASVYSDIREYRGGDSMRSIHWKLSAKQDKLITKEFEGSTSNRTTMLLNVDGLPFSYEENVVMQDYIIEGAVAIIKYLLDNNATINMLSYKTELNHVIGDNKMAFGLFYENLAKMMFSQKGFEKHLLKEQYQTFERQSQIMVFTPFISQLFYEFVTLKMAANSNNMIIFIVDPSEKSLSKCFEKIDLDPLYRLIAKGLTIYKINFEDGLCRLDVA
jgi:hypothetical protein